MFIWSNMVKHGHLLLLGFVLFILDGSVTFGRSIAHEVWNDVRLVNGRTVYEGRVEVKVKDTWGSVCDDDWSIFDGTVVCKQLGFDGVYSLLAGGVFGMGTGPVFHDDLHCNGHERSLSECPGIHDPNKTSCEHSEDAGIRCQPPVPRSSHTNCHSNQFFCITRKMCIPGRWVCDGHNDCMDNSDELSIMCRQSASCGTPLVQPVSTRVVGGRNAHPGSWPWMASLKVVFPTGISDINLCAGTLIREQWVMTAAHCFDRYKPISASFHVVLGDNNCKVKEAFEQEIPIKNVYINAHYRVGAHSNDIALIKLEHPANLSNGHVNVACLPTFEDTQDNCYITGWGVTDPETGSYPNILQQTVIPILNSSLCNNWSNSTAVKDGMLCAGYQFGGMDACKGDSGGPLSCERNKQWYVAGIVSWGDGCAQPQHPGIYTDVSYYLKWIERVIDSRSDAQPAINPDILVG